MRIARTICLILLLAPVLRSQSNLRAGLARVEITPPKGHGMAGYAERTHGASGVHDPLYATVLLLDSGDSSAAFVACDLLSFLSQRIAAEARQKYHIAHTILSMSGTHAGPAMDGRSKSTAVIEDKIIQAIGEARVSMFPATIQVAAGRAYLAFNRRQVQPDGSVRLLERNPEMRPSHPLDPAVHVIAIRDGEKLRAVLVHFAARASVLGPANLEFSADYPGALRRYVEAQHPGALCLFAQGASGDLSPARDREPGHVPAFDAVDRMGRALAAEVERALARAKPLSDATQPLRLVSERAEAPSPVIYTAGVLGGLCFLALPGEPFIEHQITFQARSECAMSLLLGYSYSGGGAWAGVIPTIRAAVAGGPGTGNESALAIGAGEMLIDRGAVSLFKLRGLLQDLPDPRF